MAFGSQPGPLPLASQPSKIGEIRSCCGCTFFLAQRVFSELLFGCGRMHTAQEQDRQDALHGALSGRIGSPRLTSLSAQREGLFELPTDTQLKIEHAGLWSNLGFQPQLARDMCG